MEALEEVKRWHVSGRSLVLDAGDEGQVWLTPALPGVVQVRLLRATPWSREEPAPSLCVDASAWPALPTPEVAEAIDHLLVRFPGVLVRVDKRPLRLQYWALAGDRVSAAGPLGPDGPPLLAESPEGGLCMDGWQVGVRFLLHPEDRFFGLGEPEQRQGPVPFNHRGRRYPIWNKHLPAPSRLVLPVLISQRGYGLFIDNPWVAEWDLGAGGRHFSYTAQGGQIAYYFIAGPELTAVLDRYTRLTGRPSLPPRWSFGLLQSKFGYRTWSEVAELVDTFGAKSIPLDGVILDLYWFRKMGDLTFDLQAFPQPAAMIAALKARGIRLIVIEEPYVTRGSRLFPEGERLGLFGRRPDGSAYTFPFWAGESALVDFTQPLARQWWADQHEPLMAMGIDGWWTDLNEPEVHPQDMVHAGGIAAAVHNVYALHMLKAVDLAHQQHRPDKRLFVLSRSGWPGTQALGVGQWSGDVATRWEALANQIPLGLSMGMVGMASWNTDIGGFAGDPPGPELYIRWIQFGAFTPVMRPHGAQQEREPWAFGPEVEAIVARYIRLRYQLLPYTYTLAREASLTGLPFMRPLVLHYPQDANTFELRDQFLWGRDLLVAPVVTQGTVRRTVYLPEGIWYDFWTSRRIRGGCQVTARAPVDTLPLFVRAGAIIPLAPERERTGGAWGELTLAVYPSDGVSRFELYEDDGESTAYQASVCAVTPITCATAGGGVQLTIGPTGGSYAGQPALRRYSLNVWMEKRPAGVALAGGETLPVRRSRESLALSDAGWWYDRNARVLHVKLPPAAEELSVQIQGI